MKTAKKIVQILLDFEQYTSILSKFGKTESGYPGEET